MGILLNAEQEMVIRNAKAAVKSTSQQVYEYSGGPGTGKTFIQLAILQELGIDIRRALPMAYIGQAAIVMRTKGLVSAKTAHSTLLTPTKEVQVDNLGNIVMDPYFNRPKMTFSFVPKEISRAMYDIMLIDEGYSMPLSMKPYIEMHNIKVVVSGDADQLPPVGDHPAYLTDPYVDRLTQIMRQDSDSAIPYIANRAKFGLPIQPGFYGDVLVIERHELTDMMIANSDVVICGTNETKEKINKKIREELLGIRSELPIIGEKLVCRKNNWLTDLDGINLANGLNGVVTNMPGVHGFDGKTFEVNFRPNLLNRSFLNLKCDYKYLTANWQDRKMIKNNPFSPGEKFEYGYATTCHMSQGSEYDRVIYIEEHLNKDIQAQLNYVGATRARKFLIYVIPTIKKFF